MKLMADFHTHTVYSHGKGTIFDNAVAAVEKGLSAVGISDHGFSHKFLCMHKRDVKPMRSECDQAAAETGIKVLLGIESNVISINGAVDLKPKLYDFFDIFLVGLHKAPAYRPNSVFNLYLPDVVLGWKKEPEVPQWIRKNNTKAFINVVKKNPVDIITHLNYGCYADAAEVAKVCADYGTYIEINTKKRHLSDDELEAMLKTDVKFVINSDAHTPDRVGDIALAEEIVSHSSIPHERIMNIDGKMPDLRFKRFKENGIL